MTNPMALVGRALAGRSVRYVLIGVSGVNLYAAVAGPGFIFVTQDYDLFLPPDPDNLVQAWAACEDAGLALWSNDEPLDRPRDRWLAERVIAGRALTRMTGASGLLVDITLVMKGYDFETVWKERRTFPGRPSRRTRAALQTEGHQLANAPRSRYSPRAV